MSKHKLDREEIMAFLLGEMEEAETSRIESMFLLDPTYSEAIEAAKSQLYEEYKSGRMSPQQSGCFERRLLPDLDADKKKFKAMLDRNEALRSVGAESPTPTTSASSKVSPKATEPERKEASPESAKASEPPTGAESGGLSMPKVFLAAALAVGAAAGAVVVFGGGDGGKEEATSQSGENASVTLAMFSVKGKSQVIVLPAGAKVDLALPLPPNTDSKSFSVALFVGADKSSLPAIRVGNVVETSVERDQLVDGRYDLELRAADNTVVGYYSFRK